MSDADARLVSGIHTYLIRESEQMRKLLIATCLLAFLLGSTLAALPWPHWRGPSNNGVSSETGLPVSWGAECRPNSPKPEPAAAAGGSGRRKQRRRAGARARPRRFRMFEGRPLTPLACTDFKTTNIAWKLPLPAYSGSTPIIWGDLIFLNVATATNTGALELWAVDRRTQSVAWKRPLADTNHMERKQNMSSPSPVTDGRHVWVMTGVGVLKAFDFEGKEIWSRNIQTDYGRFGLNWGYASSPLLQGDALYVQVLHGMKTDDPSYVLKIDKMTGKTLWRVERLTDAIHESPDSYTTPTWIEANGRAELIITGGDVVSGHDPATGREYWRADVLNPQKNRELPDRRLADDCRRSHHRADAEQPDGRHAPRRQRRRRAAATSSGRSPRGPTCRRRSATARCSTSCATTAWCTRST